MGSNLKAVLAKISKDTGEEPDNMTQKNYKAWSSGSLVLDKLTGIGGFPLGGITELSGDFSTGKCVVTNSLVYTETALRRIRDVGLKSRVLDRDNSIVNPTTLFNFKDEEVLEIETELGYKLGGTLTHKIQTLRGNRIVYTPLNEIKTGYICLLKRGAPPKVEFFAEASPYFLTFSAVFGEVYLDSFTIPIPKIFGTVIKRLKEELNGVAYTISDSDAETVFKISDPSVISNIAWNPSGALPNYVIDQEVISYGEFIRLLVKHGSVMKSRGLTIYGRYEALRDTQVILLRHGIVSELGREQLCIRDAYDLSLLNMLFLNNDSKYNKVFRLSGILSCPDMIPLNAKYFNMLTGVEITAYPNEIHADNLKRYINDQNKQLIEDLTEEGVLFQRVIAVDKAEDSPVADIEIPTTHSYVVQGFGSHNSTVALQSCARAQRSGVIPAFLDFEHSFNPGYAEGLGLDTAPDKFLLYSPRNIEDGEKILRALVESGEIALIVWDSVAASKPKKEIEKSLDDVEKIGAHSTAVSRLVAKASGYLSDSDVALVVTNQLRTKIPTAGSPRPAWEDTTGGKALKFYALLRIFFWLGATKYEKRMHPVSKREEEVPIQSTIGVEIKKNKIGGIPFIKSELKIRFGQGVDNKDAVLTMARDQGFIIQKGSYFLFKTSKEEDKTVQGNSGLDKFFIDNPDELIHYCKLLELDPAAL